MATDFEPSTINESDAPSINDNLGNINQLKDREKVNETVLNRPLKNLRQNVEQLGDSLTSTIKGGIFAKPNHAYDDLGNVVSAETLKNKGTNGILSTPSEIILNNNFTANEVPNPMLGSHSKSASSLADRHYYSTVDNQTTYLVLCKSSIITPIDETYEVVFISHADITYGDSSTADVVHMDCYSSSSSNKDRLAKLKAYPRVRLKLRVSFNPYNDSNTLGLPKVYSR